VRSSAERRGSHGQSSGAGEATRKDRARGNGSESHRDRVGARHAHLSYPYGDAGSAGPREFAIAAELGFKTAVTTRPGVLFRSHAGHLTALPRISLNGEYHSFAMCG
jgi:peptidoglycan/xylan/chitin deacetylase (PgdA/CDA1 family)